MRSPVFFALIALAGCGSANGEFPSLLPRPGETPRVIQAPGAGEAPVLSSEEKAALAANIADEERALRTAEADIRRAGTELQAALRAAGSETGSNAWMEAQLALSRFASAAAPLGEIASRLPALNILVDPLPADDADRARVDALEAQVKSQIAATTRTVDAANRQLQF